MARKITSDKTGVKTLRLVNETGAERSKKRQRITIDALPFVRKTNS